MADYQFFTPKLAETFRAAAACIVPTAPCSPGADADEPMANADAAIARRPAPDRHALALFLKALERLPLLRYGRSFSKLPPDRRAAVLRFLENNTVAKLRQGFFGLKTFALLGYYGSGIGWGELGYPGPREDVPARGPR